MTPLQRFRSLMAERRQHGKDTLDYQWRTRAARQYYLMHLKVPVTEWRQE